MAAKNASENLAFCRASFVANSHSDSFPSRNLDENALCKAGYLCGESFHGTDLPRCNMICLAGKIADCFT